MAKKQPNYADNRVETAVQAYVTESLSQSAAYLRAYPNQGNGKPDTVHSHASRFFASDKVQTRLEEVKAEYRQKHAKTVDDIVERLSGMVFADLTDIYDDRGNLLPPKSWPDGVKAMLSGIDVVSFGNQDKGFGEVLKAKFADRLKAMEMLGKQLGMWPNKLEHTGAGGGPIETKDVSENDLARRIAFLLTKGAK